MKILRIVTRLNVGGPSRQIQELINQIPCSIVQQVLFIGSCSGSEKEYRLENHQGITIIKSESLCREFNLLEDFKAFFQIRNCIVRESPDIIHTHMSKAWFLTVFACITIHRPPILVHTFHGHTFHSYFKGVNGKLNKIAQKFCASKTNLLLTVDENIRNEVLSERVGFPDRFLAIAPGFSAPEEYTRQFARKSFGFDEDSFLIGFLGRLEPIKRPDLLLEIVSEMSIRNPKISFVVAGGGTLEYLISQAQENLPLKYLGWISDVGIFYAAMDLMILTSDNEGTPLTIIEAGMVGIPTLSRAVGGVSNLIQDNATGFLVDGDVTSFVCSIEQILSSPEKFYRISQNCKTHFRESYQSGLFAAKHIEVYLKLLKPNLKLADDSI